MSYYSKNRQGKSVLVQWLRRCGKATILDTNSSTGVRGRSADTLLVDDVVPPAKKDENDGY